MRGNGGQLNGSVGKGACIQVWWLDIDSQDPHHGRRKTTPSSCPRLPPVCHAYSCLNTSRITPHLNMQRRLISWWGQYPKPVILKLMKSSVTDECVGFLSRFSSRVLLLVSSIMWEIDSTSNLPLKGRKRNKSLKIQSTEITKLRSQGPAVFQENRHKLLCIKLFL